jgi:uncharacterized protein (TIGR02453 family)
VSYFDRDFLDFFHELDQNNTKEWFDSNRKRYLIKIKEPFYEFIQELILHLQDEDKDLYTEPKESIFRINRDLRFSKNKTPYKKHVSAAIGTGGRKSMDSPAYYIQLSYNRMMFGGGVYNPSKEGLYKIRSYIQKHPEKLANLVNEKKFTDVFGTLQGEKNKKLPIEFKNTFENNSGTFIENKQFYYMTELTNTVIIIQPDFINAILPYYRSGMAINKLLRDAFNSE